MNLSRLYFRRGLHRLYLCGSILWLIIVIAWFPWDELKPTALTDRDIQAFDAKARDPDTFMAQQRSGPKRDVFDQIDAEEKAKMQPSTAVDYDALARQAGAIESPRQLTTKGRSGSLIRLFYFVSAPLIGYTLLFHVARWIYRGFIQPMAP